MRNLILGISILCLTLSVLITFKALNKPEKNPRNLASPPPIKLHESLLDVKETIPEPAQEQNRKSNVNQTLQNTISHLEQKLENNIVDSQMNIQHLENTIKQLEQKLADKIAGSQTDTQPAKNIIAQPKQKTASHKNTSRNISKIGEPENTEKSSGLLLFSVSFNSGEFVIKNSTKKLIQQSTQYILSLPPSYRVIVEGHTDNLPIKTTTKKTYRYKDNKKLSLYRAKTIAGIFEKEGIPSKRISAIGYGATHPIASNETAEGRTKNRRVVVRLIPDEKKI